MALNSLTGTDVYNYVTRQFGDESGVQVTQNDIIRWINQGQMEINSKNQILRAKFPDVSIAGTNSYNKPADCLRLTSVRYNSVLLPYVGFDQYQNQYSGISGSNGPEIWTQYGDTYIINPSPLDDGVEIDLYYVPEPSKLVNIGSTLSLPDRYFDRLCEYVMSKAYELDEDWQAHSAQRTLFDNNLTTMSNEETNAQGAYPVVVDYSYDRYYDDSMWY